MEWSNGVLKLLDQRALPHAEVWLELTSEIDVAKLISNMAVRGAPAIGIAAAYGMALALQRGAESSEAARILKASRPTAVNLAWAVDRVLAKDPLSFETALAEARAIEHEDLEMNLAIGRNGAALITPGAKILTICNTGAFATAGHGTALGIIRSAHSEGKNVHVWVCETRPRQQGLKLTTYELLAEGIPFHAISDSAAAGLMFAGEVDCVLAGADRIAANGDTANKIGTYMLAVLANHHNLPFYIAAPSSTVDLDIASGVEIPIEERDSSELTHAGDNRIAPLGTPVFNPAFDVTPGALITGIITEKGVVRAPFFAEQAK